MEHLRRLVTVLQKPRSSAAGASPYTILTITNSGGLALVTTAAAITGLLNTNDAVNISGSSVGGYNQTNATVTVVSATTFTLDEVPYISDATGGMWAVV